MASVRQSSIVCAHDRVVHRHLDRRRPAASRGRRAPAGNAAASRSFGAHAQERRRDPLAACATARAAASACAFQRQRVSNIGAASSAWTSTSRARRRVEVVEDLLEREAVLRPEREDDRLLVRRRLQLEAEADAEALAQREAPGAVDPRRRTARARRAACRRSRRRSARGRRGAGVGTAPSDALALPRRTRRSGAAARRAAHRRSCSQQPTPRPAARSSRSAPISAASSRVRPGRLAEPERDRRRRALRVGDAHDAGLDAQDPPRRVAELEDVAAVRLDREVLVDACRRACPRARGAPGSRRCRGSRRRTVSAVRRARLRRHAAGRSRRRGGAAPGAPSVWSATTCVEVRARQVAVGPGAAEQRRRARPRPTSSATQAATICCARMSSGRGGMRRAVEDRLRGCTRRSAAASTSSSSVSGKSRPFGTRFERVARRGRRAGGTSRSSASRRPGSTRSTSPMSMPSSSDAVATSARSSPGLEALLGVEPRSRARGCRGGSSTASSPRSRVELRRDALGHLARVDEDERRAVLADELRDALVDLLPLLVRADGRERRRRDLDRRGRARGRCPASTSAHVAARRRRGSGRRRRAASASRRGRCAGRAPGQRLEPLEREREVAAALVARERVDLVHDDGRDRRAASAGRRRS